MFIPTAAAPMSVEVLFGPGHVTEGEAAELSLRVTAEQDLTVVGGRVDLVRREMFFHHLAGMFNARARHTSVVTSAPLLGWGRMRAAERLEIAEVSLPIPAGSLGTTDAAIISVAWEVSVHIVAEGAPESVVTAPLIVLTRALDRVLDATQPPSADGRGWADVGVEGLATRQLRPGVLAGSVVVSPRRAWPARAVDVALLRREHVEHGIWLGDDPARNPPDQEKDREVTVARQRLADQVQLEPGRVERFPFALQVPEAPLAPSLQTQEFEISWVLRAWVVRPWRRSPFVEMGLHAPTAPPPS